MDHYPTNLWEYILKGYFKNYPSFKILTTILPFLVGKGKLSFFFFLFSERQFLLNSFGTGQNPMEKELFRRIEMGSNFLSFPKKIYFIVQVN